MVNHHHSFPWHAQNRVCRTELVPAGLAKPIRIPYEGKHNNATSLTCDIAALTR
jgi:hypothetical protein